MLETIGQRINISALSIDKPAPAQTSSLLTGSDWEVVEQDLVPNARTNSLSSRIRAIAVATKMLNPQMWERLRLEDKLKEKMIEDFKVLRYPPKWSSVLDIAVDFKLLFPADFDYIYPNRQGLEADLKEIKIDPLVNLQNPGNKEWYARDLAIMAGERDQSLYPESSAEIFLEFCQKRREEGNYSRFSKYAADFRILFPESFSKLGLSVEDWLGMRGDLESGRALAISSGTNVQMLLVAENMHILGAEQVNLTRKGLEINHAVPNFKSPVLPERRKF